MVVNFDLNAVASVEYMDGQMVGGERGEQKAASVLTSNEEKDCRCSCCNNSSSSCELRCAMMMITLPFFVVIADITLRNTIVVSTRSTVNQFFSRK